MIRTAECVTPKHPDKMCDRIADAILTEAIKQDPNARTAIEVCAGHGIVTVIGEMTTKAIIDALGLRNIDYEKTAAWGHFGIGMPWDA